MRAPIWSRPLQKAARQENHTKQDVYKVIDAREIQRANVPHSIHRRIAKDELSQKTQGEINDTER
jgi:hypothetical protein